MLEKKLEEKKTFNTTLDIKDKRKKIKSRK